jgi:hypothetical protein
MEPGKAKIRVDKKRARRLIVIGFVSIRIP